MSRMLGYVAPRAMSAGEALGDDIVDQFLDLSVLHRDGWGHASSSGGEVTLLTGMTSAPSALRHAGARPSRIAISYLRFASAGAAVSRENLQPFRRRGVSFAHNGALVPVERAAAALTAAEREALRGTGDSEMYFALLLRRIGMAGAAIETAIAEVVADVRELFPAACLNALLLVRDALVVVHSPGSVAPPLSAFLTRGFAAADLPRGHDHTYNTLSSAVLPNGARIVTTTGIDASGLKPLERDAVFVFTSDGEARWAPIPSDSARPTAPRARAVTP